MTVTKIHDNLHAISEPIVYGGKLRQKVLSEEAQDEGQNNRRRTVFIDCFGVSGRTTLPHLLKDWAGLDLQMAQAGTFKENESREGK